MVTLLPNTRSMSPRNVETSPVISPLGSSLLVRANKGRPPRAFGHAIVVLLDGKQTGGKFTTFLNITPPGGGPGPHYREREHECFYIIEAQVSVLMNGTWTDLFPGDWVYSPAVRSTVSKIIRMGQSACLSISLPRDLSIFSPEQPRSGLNPSRITTIAEKYGLHGA